jgi:hypothetical protein
MRNDFLKTQHTWRELSVDERKKLANQNKQPRQTNRILLWRYMRSLTAIQDLASHKSEWSQVDERLEFIFDLARSQKGKLGLALSESAKKFLEDLPENAWLGNRFGRTSETNGLSPIDTVPRDSYFSFWDNLRHFAIYDFSKGVTLALTVIATHDSNWIWAQLESKHNAVLIYAVARSHAKSQQHMLTMSSMTSKIIATLGTLMLLENLKTLESSAWAKIADLNPFINTPLDFRTAQRHWRTLQTRIESVLNTLIAELHASVQSDVLVEIFVWSIRGRDRRYDQRPGIVERLTQEIVGRALGEKLNQKHIESEQIIQALEKMGDYNLCLLERIATSTVPSIAAELRSRLVQHLESRMRMPAKAGEDTEKFSSIERESEYLNNAASALLFHLNHNGIKAGDWFHENFIILPKHTQDRFHNDTDWRAGLKRASFMLHLAARVLEREMDLAARVFLEERVIEFLVTRIPEWEWYRRLGVEAREHGRDETDAIWDVCQQLSTVNVQAAINSSKTAWVLLALCYRHMSLRPFDELQQRLENDISIMDVTIAGHIPVPLVASKHWRFLPRILERFELLNQKSEYPIWHPGGLTNHEFYSALTEAHIEPLSHRNYVNLQNFLTRLSRVSRPDVNVVGLFIKAGQELQVLQNLPDEFKTALRNSQKLWRFVSTV